MKTYQRQREELSNHVKQCFTTPSGKIVFAELLKFYDQPLKADHELEFKCGQRDVVQYLLELKEMKHE